MEEAAADAGTRMQACHMLRPVGKNSDRRTAQSGTGHRRLPADGGHAADDSRKDDRTQPHVADLHSAAGCVPLETASWAHNLSEKN